MLGKTLFVALSTAALAAGQSLNPKDYSSANIIKKDFAIIGGGASGTYAAIGLKDKGKSFVVVEKENRLGGHTHTYTDPKSGKSADYGVQLYLNSSVVRNFFTRLNAPYAAVNPASFGTPVYADFATKQLLPNYNAGSFGQDYLNYLKKYNPGADDLQYLKTPVDPDITLPWTDWLKKNKLSVNSTMASFNIPAVPGNLLNETAIYVFNDENDVMLQEGMAGGSLVNANHDNSQMYENAQKEIGSNVLFQSTVVNGCREVKNVTLAVKTPSGNKLIMAKSLIIAMPNTLDNMKTFGLTKSETSLFSQIAGLPYYGGIVNNTGLNNTASYPNRGANTPYNVATLPSVVTFSPTAIPGMHYYWYSSLTAGMSQASIQAACTNAIQGLQSLLKLPKTTPNYPAFEEFTPLNPRVSPQNITNGFYEDMVDLQGKRSTWYIGALFVVGSSQVWNNTNNMLPNIIAAAS